MIMTCPACGQLCEEAHANSRFMYVCPCGRRWIERDKLLAMTSTEEARRRLVTAALRLAVAERGGADGQDAGDELHRALDTFNEAAVHYVHSLP